MSQRPSLISTIDSFKVRKFFLILLLSLAAGLAVRAAVPILTGANAGKIQIFLTGNAPAAPGVNVAWFVFG